MQLLGAVERCRRTLDLQADGAHGCPVRDVVGMCEAFLFLVDDEIDCALRPARHGLRLVLRDVAEPEAGDELLELLGGPVIDGKLDEFDAKAFRSRRHLRNIGKRLSAFRAQLIHQIDQRALPIDGDRARRTGAELVVENLERQVALIAGRCHRAHEIEQRHIPLPRKAAEMPAPVQHIHLEPWRIGKLDEKNPVAGNGAHRREIGLAGERVKRVEDETNGGMVRAAHHLPGIAVVVDMAPPRQRLEADTQFTLGRTLAEFMKIRRAAINAAERVGRDVAANQQ